MTARLRLALETTLEWLVILLTTALAAVVIVAVAFRKAGVALVWYDEVAAILLVWLTFYGSGLAALKHAHIGFPRVVRTMGPRARLMALVAREAVVLGFFAAVALAGWQVVVGLGGSYLVSLPGVPRAVSQSAIPLGAVAFMAAELLGVIERARRPAT